MLRKIKFRVIHVTSQDDQYPAKELNYTSPNTKGWRSTKNCPYPQQIVIELERSVRIRKIQILSHQALIASKVEFFVGDCCGEDTINLETSRFTCLGHVELSSNEATSYRSRELKSVHIDAYGSCFQIFLYKNYSNVENPFNQISIIALNFIGEVELSKLDPLALGNNVANPDYFSPMEDLAFAVYQDPRFADIIRRLQCQKMEYARQENFEMAKKTRDAIRCIQEAGEQLCRLEVEKQEAVKVENFEEAIEKKEKIELIRQELARNVDLDSLLSAAPRLQHYSRPDIPPSPHFRGGLFSPHQSEGQPEVNVGRCSSDSTASSGDAFPARHWHNVADERPLPALLKKQTNNSNAEQSRSSEYDFGDGGDGGDLARRPSRYSPVLASPEELNDEQVQKSALLLADQAIDVVGLPLVKKFFSRSWKLREEALVELEGRVTNDPLAPPVSLQGSNGAEADPYGEIRSTTCLLKRALADQVLVVYRKAVELVQPLIVEFGERHRINKQEILSSVDKLLPALLQRTGESSARIRDLTKAQLVAMAKWPLFRGGVGFWHELLRPFQPTTLERLALSQMEIVSDIYANMGSNDHDDGDSILKVSTRTNSLLIDDLITFTVHALEHRSIEVREVAESLVVALYRQEDRRLVRSIMPKNDAEAQRQPLYRRIFNTFDNIDGPEKALVPSSPPRNASRSRPSQQVQPAPSKPVPVQSTRKSPHLKNPSPQKSPASPLESTSELDLLLSLDKTCIFCGEQNEDFTEEALDLHYWRACPMLRRCPNCKQVVEISGLTEHLLNECPESMKAGGYKRCKRCSEAIPASTFSGHKSCKLTSDASLRCPLCHADLPSEGLPTNNHEEAWKAHLMGDCTQNSRLSRPSTTDSARNGAAKGMESVFPRKKAFVNRVR